MNGPFEPVEPGFTWGKTWEYCWFRGKVVLPAEAQGKRIVMDLKPDGESTLFVNGQEFGTYRASWVTQKHHFVEDNVLTTDAVAGTEYEILMETYAGHYYPDSPDGGSWPYFGKDGKIVTAKWMSINGKTYYFDEDGLMQTGLLELDGQPYYLGEEDDGARKTGGILLDTNTEDTDDEDLRG